MWTAYYNRALGHRQRSFPVYRHPRDCYFRETPSFSVPLLAWACMHCLLRPLQRILSHCAPLCYKTNDRQHNHHETPDPGGSDGCCCEAVLQGRRVNLPKREQEARYDRRSSTNRCEGHDEEFGQVEGQDQNGQNDCEHEPDDNRQKAGIVQSDGTYEAAADCIPDRCTQDHNSKVIQEVSQYGDDQTHHYSQDPAGNRPQEVLPKERGHSFSTEIEPCEKAPDCYQNPKESIAGETECCTYYQDEQADKKILNVGNGRHDHPPTTRGTMTIWV